MEKGRKTRILICQINLVMNETSTTDNLDLQTYPPAEGELRGNEAKELVAASREALYKLKEMQGKGGYSQSSNLHELERACYQKLAELIRIIQFEVDTPISLNRAALLTSFVNVSKAYLVSDLVVVAVDSDGNVTSKPLSRLPPATIISVAQESTPQLQKLISDKWEFTASRIKTLQKLVDELRMGAATFNQSRPEGVELQGRVGSAERWAPPKDVVTETPNQANEKSTEEVVKEKYQSWASNSSSG